METGLCSFLKTDTLGNTKKIFTGGGDYNNVWGSNIVCDENCNIYAIGWWNGGPPSLQKPCTISGVQLSGRAGAFVIKINADETVAWVKQFNGRTGLSGEFDIALDQNNDIYALVSYVDTLAFTPTDTLYSNQGSQDVCLLKFANSGQPLWAKSFGGAKIDNCGNLVCDNQGNIYITSTFQEHIKIDNFDSITSSSYGSYTVKVKPDKSVEWVNPSSILDYRTNAMTIASDGSTYRGGYSGRTSYLEKTDASGNWIWTFAIYH